MLLQAAEGTDRYLPVCLPLLALLAAAAAVDAPAASPAAAER